MANNYNPQVIERLIRPRNVGELEHPDPVKNVAELAATPRFRARETPGAWTRRTSNPASRATSAVPAPTEAESTTTT